jgi:hypothetical protein
MPRPSDYRPGRPDPFVRQRRNADTPNISPSSRVRRLPNIDLRPSRGLASLLRCSIVSLIRNVSAQRALVPSMNSGGVMLTVVGLLGRVVMPSSRTRGGRSRIPVKLLAYQKSLLCEALLLTRSVSPTARVRLLMISLRENGRRIPLLLGADYISSAS